MKVYSIFQSISGEVSPFHQGRICTFIRFSGCFLQPKCLWCDQPEAWPLSSGKEMSPMEILQKIHNTKYKQVIITGGEPLIQPNLADLIELLRANNFCISIETSGTVIPNKDIPFGAVNWVVDVKGPSSGVSRKTCFPYKSLYASDIIKFPIADKLDFQHSLNFLAGKQTKTLIAFSPIHGKMGPRTLMNWIMNEGLDAILNVQLHKVIGVD